MGGRGKGRSASSRAGSLQHQSCVRRERSRGISETRRGHSGHIHGSLSAPRWRIDAHYVCTLQVFLTTQPTRPELRATWPHPPWSRHPQVTLPACLHRLGSVAAEGVLLQRPVKSLGKKAAATHFRSAFSRLYFSLLFRTRGREL